MSEEIKDPQPLVDRIVGALDDACKRGDWAYVRAVVAATESFRRHLTDVQLAILRIRGAASRHRLEADRDAALAEVAKLRAALDMIVRSADDRTINNRPSGLVHVHRHWIDHARALLAGTGGER